MCVYEYVYYLALNARGSLHCTIIAFVRMKHRTLIAVISLFVTDCYHNVIHVKLFTCINNYPRRQIRGR